MKKVVLFGCGSGLDLFMDLQQDDHSLDIVAIADNRFASVGTAYGKNVISPYEIKSLSFDQVYITNRYCVDSYNQLCVMGIPKSKINIFAPIVAGDLHIP